MHDSTEMVCWIRPDFPLGDMLDGSARASKDAPRSDMRSVAYTQAGSEVCSMPTDSPEFNQMFLVNANPVGEKVELHMMDDRVSPELILAAMANLSGSGALPRSSTLFRIDGRFCPAPLQSS